MKKLSKITLISSIIIVSLILAYFILTNVGSNETYTFETPYGDAVLTIGKGGGFDWISQVVTFPSGNHYPGDKVTFYDSYAVPDFVPGCVYYVYVSASNNDFRTKQEFAVPCIDKKYRAGDTIKTSLSMNIPNSDSSIGQWIAISSYKYSNAGCNMCPSSGGILLTDEKPSNKLNVIAKPECNPDWECTSWSECNSGTQTRTCTDANSCGKSTGKPTESQSCSVNTPSCSDGIQNQDETGIDCGGSICSACQTTEYCYDSQSQCTEVECDSSNQNYFVTLAECEDALDICIDNPEDESCKVSPPPTDWITYVGVGIVGLLILVLGFLLYRRYK
jgi:hypothetical protein